jgi:hypothetical protein
MNEDTVIEALAEQLGLYRRLMKLAELQHQCVSNGSTEELLGVLGQRREVLEEVGAIEQGVTGIRKDWGQYLGGLDEARRSRVEALMGETRQILEDITTADRNDAMVLQQRKLDLGRQINRASAARQVNRNYASAAYGKTQGRMDLSQ